MTPVNDTLLEADIDAMIRDFGVTVEHDDDPVGMGIVDKFDADLLTTSNTQFTGRTVRVVTKTSAFTEIKDGDELTFNGGVYKVMQTRLRSDGKIRESLVAFEEAELNTAAVQALIEKYMNERAFFSNPLAMTPTLLRGGVGWTVTPAQGSLHLLSPVGANRFVEYSLLGFNEGEPLDLRAGTIASLPRRLGCYVGPALQANPTDTMHAGIEIGSFEDFPPWSSAPGYPLAQLRICGATDGLVEFVTAKSDGTPAIVRQFMLGPLKPHGLILELEVDPDDQTVSAYADNQLLGTSLPVEYPDFDAVGSGVKFGIFASTGTSGSGQTEVWFSMPFHRSRFDDD